MILSVFPLSLLLSFFSHPPHLQGFVFFTEILFFCKLPFLSHVTDQIPLTWLIFTLMQLHYRPYEPAHAAVNLSDLGQECLAAVSPRGSCWCLPGELSSAKRQLGTELCAALWASPSKSFYCNATPDLCFLSLSCLFPRSWIRQYHYTDSHRWLNSVGLIRKMLSVQQEISARNLQMLTAMNQNLATFCPVFSGRQLPTLLKGRLSTGEFGSHISQVKKSQCQTLKTKPAPPKPHLYSKVLHTRHWASLGFPSKVCFECWK